MTDAQRRLDDDFDHGLRLWADLTTQHSLCILNPQGRVLYCNPCAEHTYGRPTSEIVGHHFSVFFTDRDRDAEVPAGMLDAARDKGSYATEAWCVHGDGRTFWAYISITALREQDGHLVGFAEVMRDVTANREAHDAAIDSERQFRLLVQGVTDYAIFMLSPEGYVTNWNLGARRIKGYTGEEIIGSHFSRFYTAEDVAAGLPQRGLETAAREGRFEGEGWRVRRDGTTFWAHVIIDAVRDEEGGLIGFAKVTRDVTERRQASELLEQTRAVLFQSQKMEAIGKLTGGVAHDFNNVLQVLRGNLELLESRYRRDPWSAERLDQAIDAVDRGAKLASQLLAFGRRQVLRPVVVNLASMLRGMDDLLRRALGETIALETVIAGGLWNAEVDVHQLENVLLNLAINARDAMPGGGKLTLELANAMLDDHYVRSVPDIPAGQYVMLGITDTGTGMSPEVAERAFDPFFTTKPEGQGTGLGLSMAYGFVKQSGGHIRIYSEIEHGTSVKVYLPRSKETVETPPLICSERVMGGKETVLVVEDDPKVRSTVIIMLSELGYTVLKADDAEQALAVMHSGVHIDLLFTDVVMPGAIKSPEMVRQAVAMRPHLKVLFTSGYTQNAIVHGGRLDPGVELLSKPYSQKELAHKIRLTLGTRGEALTEGGRALEVPRSPTSTGLRVLVVDDDVASLDAVLELLELSGHVGSKAASAVQALDEIISAQFDVLLTDINLPGMSGIELARRAVSAQPRLFVVFASGDDMRDEMPGDFSWRALRKPYTLVQLQDALQAAMNVKRPG